MFTFYKHRRKQISAVILKLNIEVTFTYWLSLRKFSFVRQLRLCIYIYAQIYDFSYVRKFCDWRYACKKLRTQNLRTETGVRTFVNSTPSVKSDVTIMFLDIDML